MNYLYECVYMSALKIFRPGDQTKLALWEALALLDRLLIATGGCSSVKLGARAQGIFCCISVVALGIVRPVFIG